MRPLVVGTRGSRLALLQTEEVLRPLRMAQPEREFTVRVLQTGGDRAKDAPLGSLGVGIFVGEIEEGLLRGEIDMAVHSLKDLTPVLRDGLAIGAVCERMDPRDALVNRWNLPLEELPHGARIGTSSPRRTAQLRHWAPQLRTLPMRGNVNTRVEKTAGPDYDGAVLAAAGLLRLGLSDRIAQFLPTDTFVPAPGQGALAVEILADDHEVAWLLRAVNHMPTRLATTAEMAFLERLGYGCQEPSGAYARISGDTMVMRTFVASADGSQVFAAKTRGFASNPHEVAMEAHQQLLERGAGVILGGNG